MEKESIYWIVSTFKKLCRNQLKYVFFLHWVLFITQTLMSFWIGIKLPFSPLQNVTYSFAMLSNLKELKLKNNFKNIENNEFPKNTSKQNKKKEIESANTNKLKCVFKLSEQLLYADE